MVLMGSVFGHKEPIITCCYNNSNIKTKKMHIGLPNEEEIKTLRAAALVCGVSAVQ